MPLDDQQLKEAVAALRKRLSSLGISMTEEAEQQLSKPRKSLMPTGIVDYETQIEDDEEDERYAGKRP